jgi:hypothetical protein
MKKGTVIKYGQFYLRVDKCRDWGFKKERYALTITTLDGKIMSLNVRKKDIEVMSEKFAKNWHAIKEL